MITVLLDTNIIMDLEDTGHPLSKTAAEVLKRARGSVDPFIHELQYEDINNDKNDFRRNILLTRIAKFKKINNPPEPTKEKFQKRGWTCVTRNDFIDNALLLCVEKHAVSFLITNDKGILEKAFQSGLRDRVLTLDEFEEILPTAAEPINLAAVNDSYCYELDIDDPFFDSLRASYDGFNDWFEKKCCEAQRKCWVVKRNEEIAGLCIYKDEQGEPINDGGLIPRGKTLKLCTLKVGESARGCKIGERLLYCAFNYALKNGHTAIYFTTNESQQTSLIELGYEFGFDKNGYHGSDAVYLKYMAPQYEGDISLDNAEFIRRFYPSYKDDEGISKYIVPIIRKWHERLFPDISDLSRSLFRDFADLYAAEGNTIKKAYLTGSPITIPKVGDLLLFYQTKDRQVIDTMGVVVGATRSADVDEIVALTKRRTVYNPQEIQSLVTGATKGVLIISFNLICYFEDHPVSLSEMRHIGMSAPQSIAKLSEARYRTIRALAK